MGAWGVEPDEDDRGLDFLGDFFDAVDAGSPIRQVFETFRTEPEGLFPEVRAACLVLEALAGLWPRDTWSPLATEGIELLGTIRSSSAIAELWGDADRFFAAVDRQIESLRSKVASG